MQPGRFALARAAHRGGACSPAARRFPGFRRYGLGDYWLTSITTGIRSLPGRYWKQAAARIVNPLSYPRMMEYALVHEALGPLDGKRVLDIGSPKLPALLLARDGHVDLHATDIRDYFIGPTAHFAKRIGVKSGLHLEVEDARSLTYPAASFDAIYSISVLEHIPKIGDSDAMREIARVLRPGGIVAITVPFSASGYREDWVRADVYERSFEGEEVFYQRHYDTESLRRRLIEPSGLVVGRIEYFGEPGLRFEPTWNRIPMTWKIPLLWAQPFIAKVFLKRVPPGQIERACGVALLLQKPLESEADNRDDGLDISRTQTVLHKDEVLG